MLTDRSSAPALRTRLLAVAVVSGMLSGCTLGYLTQAAHGQWQLMRARRPITQVIADPTSPQALVERLRVVQDAREFAVTDLALPDNRSYRTYSDLKRPFVVWNVVATPEFSVEPRHWCFPFTGCLSYRGYFHQQAADRMAARLASQGDDVMVGGVTAYSTLGHFADPVLNTMLRYGDLGLASTLFHELAHQLIYVRGDTEFNESFAVTVEQEGLRRWLAARGRSQELDDYLNRHHADELMLQAFADGRRRLAVFYRQSATLPVEQRRAGKLALLSETGQQVQALEQQFHVQTGYDRWIAAGLNNAHLASLGTYFDCVPAFQGLLASHGGDLPAFYTAVRKMRSDPAARRAFCQAAATTPAAARSGPAHSDAP